MRKEKRSTVPLGDGVPLGGVRATADDLVEI